MNNSWLKGIVSEESPLHKKLIELLDDKNVVWEGLGPDGIDSLSKNQLLEYESLEEDYRNRIVTAFKEEDYLTMGKMFHFMLSNYLLAVCIHQDPSFEGDVSVDEQ